jgi:transcriptional regulator with XRE-family HTH domain
MSESPKPFASIDKNFAANLREYRESRGMSQEELAQRMTERGFGFSQATIWKIEQGKRPVKISEAAALADAIDLLSWSELTLTPEASRHHARLQRANREAYDTYVQTKAAAAAYIDAQMELAVAARHAHDAGLDVSTFWISWLETPPERAVIEARIEGDQHDDVHGRIDEAVDQVLQVLRDWGFEAILHPEDVEECPAETLPTWTPQ